MKNIWRKKQDSKPSKGKVLVALSGGVDSSVCAYLLKEQGYDVECVYIVGWQPEFWECNSKRERLDALQVSATLKIPFRTLYAEKEYKQKVVDPFIEAYKRGEVPNPDVLCNEVFKFGVFYDYAFERDISFIATGHYVRNGTKSPIRKGIDKKKDQSYFLWSVNKDRLKKTLFPIGEYEKDEVREIARKAGLPNAEKKDSQGICFLGDGDMKDFLSRYIETNKGDVVDESGDVIGKHNGVVFYTLGQRHGFTITNSDTNRKPFFIINKDIKNNILTVSNTPISKNSICVRLANVNWLVDNIPELITAQASYHGKEVEVKLVNNSDGVFIYDKNPVVFYTKGQSVVMYDGDNVVGGGVVEETKIIS